MHPLQLKLYEVFRVSQRLHKTFVQKTVKGQYKFSVTEKYIIEVWIESPITTLSINACRKTSLCSSVSTENPKPHNLSQSALTFNQK